MARVSGRRVAVIALGALALIALAGPGVAPSWAGFEADEQHTAFPFAAPGFADVPAVRQVADGDGSSFAILDADVDGRLACGAGGKGDCPEARQAAAAARALLLTLAEAWQSGGEGAAVPEGAVRATLSSWPAFADAVLAPCGGSCTVSALIASSRFLRVSPATLAAMDADRDGVVTRAEYRGAPVTRPHLLGTDGLGRDAFVRLLDGLGLSLVVGTVAAVAAALFGVAYGATAGLAGGATGAAMMRVVDVLYGLPYVFLVILLISLLGPSTANLLVAIACVQWLTMARTVRGLAASLATATWAESARVQGCGPVRLAVAHLIPNARRPILTWAALLVPASIKEEAFLSFLGLGVQAPAASLGTLIADGAPRIGDYPWLVAAPAAALFLVVLLINLACEDAG
jgi:oligopeptide transport system permease protein